MPSESQLKAKIQAAIAKKKQEQQKPAAPVVVSPAAVAPAVVELTKKRRPPSDAITSEAELIRTFSGRAVRVGVYQKKVYFSVPDVMGISNSPGKTIIYENLKNEEETRKIIEPLVIKMMFPNLNGGSEKLDAAVAEDLMEIISQLNIPFPEPIDKWLQSTAANLQGIIG